MAEYWWGTGRRKTSVARVRLREGSGMIEINGRDIEDYFPRHVHREEVLAPLKVTSTESQYDVLARVEGGGLTGHAGAMKLGIARALRKIEKDFEKPLKEHGYLTRDARMVERKKFGRHKARRGHQTSKR